MIDDTRASGDGERTFLVYARRGKTSWWRYPLAAMLAFVLTICIGVALALGLQVLKLLPADLAALMLHADNPQAFFLLNGSLFGLLLLGFALAIRWLHGKRPGDLLGAWSWRRFGMGAVLWLAVLAASAGIDFALAPTGFSITAGPQTAGLALAALVGLFVQTLAEEVIFRGYLTQGLLLALKRPVLAALVAGCAFGALHLPNGLPQAVNATAFGIVMSWIAIRTGGIAFTFGLHLANNLFGAVVLVSGADAFRGSPGVLTQNTPQLLWWDTGIGVLGLIVLAFWMSRSGRATGLGSAVK